MDDCRRAAHLVHGAPAAPQEKPKVSPHTSALSAHYMQALLDKFARNLLRYRAGEPLEDGFDPARGY